MADERPTNQNHDNQEEQGKAMGAAANAGAQGQERPDNSPSEVAGQGGGIQGSGQSQSNPGGYTGGDQNRDDAQSNQGSAERRPDPSQGE